MRVLEYQHLPEESENPISERTVYVESHGCAANKFDLDIMLFYLRKSGYKIVSNVRSAKIVLLNTCGVKKPTEDRMVQKLRKFSLLKKAIIIAGCLPRINLKAILSVVPDFSAVLDPKSVDKIPLALDLIEKGCVNNYFFSEKPLSKLEQPRLRTYDPIGIIVISEGCLGACSFCCVRFARGGFFSYSKEAIIKRLNESVGNGVREIWLTSQDNGAYGLDIKTNIAELVQECCKVEGKFLVRVGMMNPNHALRMLQQLIEVYENDKVFKFLHLPVQSGENETLRRMNRPYTVEQFKEVVDSFRKEIPAVTLATDVICGFPNESRDAFEMTRELLEEVQPDVVNVSRFFPRPNTRAEKMAQIGDEEVNYRSRKLTGLIRKISLGRNSRWLGWNGEILIDEKGKGFSWIGRNSAYKPIVVRTKENLFGRFVQVKIVKVFSKYLEGKVLE